MSRDQGAASGGQVREPGRCACEHLEPLHVHRPGKPRGACSANTCQCRTYRPEVCRG